MDSAPFVKQLEGILTEFKALAAKSAHDDLSELPKTDRQAIVSKSVAAIHRITGPQSSYSVEVERLFRTLPPLHAHTTSILGVVQALLDDLKNDHLQSLVALVHADTFADFLEMAQHLHESGYKDAAAVIAGSALEAHLRGLCTRSGLATESKKTDGTFVAKKADLLNSELCAAGVYTKLDQKNVTAWLDLRNKAAHGKYDGYQAEQVALQIAAVRDFIQRHPA